MTIMSAEEANEMLRFEMFPNVGFPEGFREKLLGKTIEEQLESFRITLSDELAQTPYAEITGEAVTGAACRPEEHAGFEGLVVHEGLIVGVLMRAWGDTLQACPPYGGVYTSIGYNEDGSRAREKDECAYLICV